MLNASFKAVFIEIANSDKASTTKTLRFWLFIFLDQIFILKSLIKILCVWSVISFDSLIKISCLRWFSCKFEGLWIIKNILTYTLIYVSCVRSICDDIFCLFIENTNISVMLSWWEFFSYNLLHIDWTLLTFTFFNLSNFVFSNWLFLFKIQYWVVSLFILF